MKYIVIIGQAWCNENGVGIAYGWDGEEFDTLPQARKHGFRERGSDDFNIGHVEDGKLVWFGWMDEPDDTADLAEMAEEIGLEADQNKGSGNG